MMLNLIKKDFLLVFSTKANILLILLYIPLINLVVGTSEFESMISVMIISFVYILTIIPFAYEKTDKPHILIQSLPIKRKDVVISKYISIFISYILGIIFVGVYLWVTSLFGLKTMNSFKFSLIINLLPILIFSLSISLPLQFRLPTRIANFVNGLIMITLINTTLIGKNILNTVGVGDLTLFIIVAVVYLVSMIASIWIYEGRDFI